ncbi:DNA cytosine methyltransferase [Peribacillus alkalitolerans]|uniref:DNA cytosine methyltransferase n=1 Tax=Peribacillus alkalitolerans TaxID=1550385 RepID=UPI0013D7B913|nr:DNA (cytosine-5-)-methyltransferase [Peribacillus alkalitolerans]
MNKKPTVISLFAGAGGMDLGFVQAGFDVVWANDFEQNAVNTYRKNIGDHIVLGDITKIESSSIPGEPGEIDVVIGGFPCQGFSVANTKRSMEDKRNFLYLELLRIVKDKRPKFFIAENVKGLISMSKGQVLDMIIGDFKDLGYKVDFKVLNAADFGVPQLRERVIIMGNRLDIDNPFPFPTHFSDGLQSGHYQTDLFHYKEDKKNLPKHVTVKEAIDFLSDVRTRNESFVFSENDLNNKFENDSHMNDGPSNGVNMKRFKLNKIDKNNFRSYPMEWVESGGIIHNHVASENVSDKFWGRKHEVNQFDICDYLKEWRKKSGISVKNIDKHFGYNHTAGHWFRKDNNSGSIPKPEDWWGLKKLLGFDDKYDKQVTEFVEKEIKFEQSLRITNWDRPSDTITASQPEIHVNKKRRLSVRECAILQTFPMDFEFTGSLNAMYRQVGNAVPVMLGKAIAESVFNVLSKVENSNSIEVKSNEKMKKLLARV